MNTINTYNTSQSKYRLGDKALYTNINTTSSNVQKRYFSGIDAEIYFGETYIDEAVNINFNLQQNTLPIYGYNSYIFDTIAQGTRLIQGSFTVNFTRSGYLYEVLNTLSIVNSGAKLSHINHACNNMTVSKNQSSPLWDKCFDIVIAYGNIDSSSGSLKPLGVDLSSMVILRGVYLIGCEQDFGTGQPGGKGPATGGMPLYETYYFYARDIEYDDVPNTPDDYTEDIVITEPVDLVKLNGVDIVYNRQTKSYDISCYIDYDPSVEIITGDGYQGVSISFDINGVVFSQPLLISDDDITSAISMTRMSAIASSSISSGKLFEFLDNHRGSNVSAKEIQISYYVDGTVPNKPQKYACYEISIT